MLKGVFVIRADSGLSIGLGHLMRCWALAQALIARGVSVHVVSAPLPKGIEDWLIAEGGTLHYMPKDVKRGSIQDADAVSSLASSLNARWVIMDGYCFDEAYQQQLKSKGHPVLAVDDTTDGHYVVDAVLNQNPGYVSEDYSATSQTRFFLGLGYALLRKGFEDQQSLNKSIKVHANHIVLSTGGEDPLGMTARILQLLMRLDVDPIIIKVIWGPLNGEYPQVDDYGKGHKVEFLSVAPQEIPSLMVWTDLAFSAGGSMLWEYAACKIPVAAFIAAKNQEHNVNWLSQQGAISSLGWVNDFNPDAFCSSAVTLISNATVRRELSEKISKVIYPRRINELITYLLD